MATPTAAYPPLPYPGARPSHPFLQVGDGVLVLERDGGGWCLLATPPVALDRWLKASGAAPMARRTPLLCYGSNACPAKILDLRRRCDLIGPVVMTPCTVQGLAAAWCGGLRAVDGSVPATLIPYPGTESHFIWWVAQDQWPALNRCEGHTGGPLDRYALAVLPAASVSDNLGQTVNDVRAYVGKAVDRRPVLDDSGGPLLVRDVCQAQAQAAVRRRTR